MRIAHLSDIHFCDKYLDEVNRVAAFATQYLHELENRPELIVLSGDLFDHRLEQNSPAYLAAIRWVCDLGNLAPVFILQGTYSHDAPHALDVFRHVHTAWPVYVSDRIDQVLLDGAEFVDEFSVDHINAMHTEFGMRSGVLISCLPSINKGSVAAAVGVENAGAAVGEVVAQLLTGWAASHQKARAAGIPTIVVSHGTVSGSTTEHGCVMAGLDHEYSVGHLFAAEASAVMLGHIHKPQSWERDGRRIAYAGSIGRLHFGEIDPKGFLMWDVSADRASFEFIETPARKLLDIEFPGSPAMDELTRYADQIRGEQNIRVRLRWAVDEEHRHSVDREAIERLFEEHDLKIEARIIPVQRQRAAGISQSLTNADRLRQWCELTDTPAEPLLERLALLEEHGVTTLTEDEAA